MPPRHPKRQPRLPKRQPRPPKRPPRHPKMPPKTSQEPENTFQDLPKRSQIIPRWPPRVFLVLLSSLLLSLYLSLLFLLSSQRRGGASLLGGLGAVLGGLGGILGGLRPAWCHFCRFKLNRSGAWRPLGSKKGPNMAPKLEAKTNQNRRQK